MKVGAWRGHTGISWRFLGVLFVGVRYRESFGILYCITFSQPFLVFMAYSCSWRDCALGELLIIFSLFHVQNNLSLNTQNNACKNVEQ